MDPVGPWSAYAASYNRLTNASSFQNASPTELHHMGGGVQSSPSSTPQLLAAHSTPGLAGPAPSPFTSAGFLSPPPVGYDAVFTPLFHQKAHYGIQHRPIKQTEGDTYNQMTPNNYFDQNNGPPMAWSQNNPQLPSPFGILPHESVVPTSPGSTPKSYENFNAHFAAAQTLNQLTEFKNSSFADTKKRSMSPLKSGTPGNPFFQQMLSPSDASTHFKQSDYSAKNFQNGHPQQACNISSPPSQEKEYRVPQPPRAQYQQQRCEKPRAFTPKQLSAQKQPPKIYDTEKRTENDSQSSPISFAMMDSQRNFQSAKAVRSQQFQQIPNQQAYRFPMTPESDYQRSKSTESFGSTSSNPDCNIGLPRRPSPLHAQPSPSAHAQSPVYPMYNSPLTTISSPSPVQHDSCFNKQQTEVSPPLDVTVPRNNIPSSVITRNDSRFERVDYSKQQWDERQRRYLGYDTQTSQSRQQYYDPGHQVTLQDLSSCRGDPMSLVKTLQQQQPEKSPDDKPKKRRKSAEKPSDSEYLPRVPPPAHHNGNQTNQNGYFDLDRWNLAPPPGKIFSTSPVAFSGQSNSGNNFSNEQPQSLMVSHSGPPPPYFPPFNSQQSPPPEPVPSTVEPEPVQPKVIVPNIAEELQTLLEDDTLSVESPVKSNLCPKPNTGFMSSFSKFLQGEKESSPPPSAKPVRKPKIYQPSDSKDSTSSDVPPVPEFPSDPQDDPRYFPLPKSTDKRNFNSSDSELSETEFPSVSQEGKKVDTPPASPVVEITSNKEEEKTVSKSSRKKEKKRHKSKKKKKSRNKDSPETVVPRRELSKRKAKERSFPLLIEDVETENSIPEYQESDSDPPWSPRHNGSEEDSSHKRVTRTTSKRKVRSPRETSDEEDIPVAERIKKKKHKKKSLCSSKKPSEKSQKKSPPQIIYPSKASSGSKSNNFPFNIGEFVVLRADTHLRHPPIWRLKEKTMLQKYIHFVQNGTSLYTNLPFFTGWSPESKNTYEGVVVKVISTTKQDMVVQLLSSGIQTFTDNERKIVAEVMQQTLSYLENFEVYIQTLFSQALGANFLLEVFQEDDEYFLLNIRAIDSLVSDMEKRLIDALGWPEGLTSAVQYYSSYKCQPKGGIGCRCGNPGIVLLSFSGIGYNKDTLQPEESSSKPPSLDIVLCRDCLSHLEILFKLCHFKCSLYAICHEKVNEVRDVTPNKDTTLILDELVQDDAWLSQLFEGVRKDWGYVEALIAGLRPASTSSQ